MSRHKLGDLLKIQHGYAFKSDNYVAKSQYRLVTLGNFASGNSFKYNDEKATYYGAEFPEEFILKEGDLIMPMTEQVIGLFGNTAFIPETADYTFVLNQRVGKVIYDESKVDKYYLHYLLATSSVKQQIEARASGTRQRNISPENVYDVEVDIPDIRVQEKIGQFLYLLEKKQIMNNKTIQELEIMAKAIYDYWFLQFDFPNEEGKPYKSSGGKMVWNEELGREIPEGWRVGNLSNIGEIIGGGTPSTAHSEYYCEKGIAWLTPNDLSNTTDKYISHGERDISQMGLENSSAKLMPKGTVLLTSRAPIGYLGIAINEVCTNQGFKSIVPYEQYGSEYVFYTVLNLIPHIKSLGTGSTFTEVSKDVVSRVRTVLPPQDVVGKFNDAVKVICGKREEVEQENKELKSLRDFLLPLLMNGQVGFSN